MAPECHLLTLPDDIKYLILTSLPDLRSLKDLCKAAPIYAGIHTDFEFSIDRILYLRDALKYSRESIWIAAHRGLLYRYYTTEKEVQGTVDEYVDYVPGVEGPGCYSTELRLLEDKIISNHRYLRAVYEELSQRQLKKRQDAAFEYPFGYITAGDAKRDQEYYLEASPGEEKKIMSSLYRSWVITLLTSLHKSTLQMDCYIGFIFGRWSFWEFMCVRAVQNMLWCEINQVIEDVIFDITNEFDLVGEAEIVSFARNFTNSTASVVLLHDFPAGMLSWFEQSKAESSNVSEQRRFLVKRMRELRDIPQCRELDIPIPNLGLFDFHRQFLMKNLPEDAYIRAWDFGKRRVVKPGRKVTVEKVGEKSYWIRGTDLTAPGDSAMDLHACIWDGWRLKCWGFGVPVNPSVRVTQDFEDPLIPFDMGLPD
ncbi:hypothetical protein AA313_de0207597 [Arthrobotrys entomopaga]|nr:hypothetical protein AA313_de0207597 [Arthrobotrys entomopaga]